ncbi:hypothetical protein FHU39_001130 [Flexivirga oryzae]|uniref:DUF222 domain-containing protein n=1 Tax=Flexivirga oryzae TaxID=1794944 RepID=A0A839N669_9MICO|nr:hypothetical protein [Flexivirga oryzae]MBB2891146.1 hypothetical protein [Flexivirga oryzae]
MSREHLGDLIQAAERVKAFADAALVDATAALVADITAHRKAACQAVVHEVQLLTGSTITAARDRVRFATALDARVHGAQELLRTGGCTWDRARIAYTETKHLDPVLAGHVIDRLLAPPQRTTSPRATQGTPAGAIAGELLGRRHRRDRSPSGRTVVARQGCRVRHPGRAHHPSR